MCKVPDRSPKCDCGGGAELALPCLGRSKRRGWPVKEEKGHVTDLFSRIHMPFLMA